MPLDTRIALGGQPLQLESPLAQYGQLMNVVNAGTQNQLAQMQMSAAQRAADEEAGFKNYLSTADLTTPEGQRGAMAYGKTGMSALKTIAEQKKASLESDKLSSELLGIAHKNFASRYSPLEAAAGQEQGVAGYIDAMYKDPILGPLAAKVKSKEQALAENLAMFKKDPNQWITAHANLEGQHLLDALKMSAAREAEARAFMPPAGTPTVPMNAPAAPVAPVAPPVISQDRLTVSQDASGTSTYYIDGKPVDPQTFAAARASSAPATMLPNTRAADLASMSPAAATTPAPAVAPAAPVVVPAAVTAPTAAPDVLNNLALRIKGIEEQRNRLLPDIGKSAAVKAQWEDLGKQIDNLSKGFSVAPGAAHFVPGVGMIEREPTSSEITTMKALGYPVTQDGFKAFSEAKRQERLLTPEEEAQRLRLAKAGATNVNVNAGQKAEDVEFGKYVVDQYKVISDQARLAEKSLPAIDINLRTLDKGFDTGFGTETKAAGASVLAALGVKDAAQYATDAQTFLANANSAVLQKQIEQKGPQTESDAQRINATGAQLGNTKEANRFILNVAKAQLQRDIDQRKFYSDWQSEHGTFKGAEVAWASGPGSASLFDTPALKKYTAPAPAAQTETRKAGLDKIFGGAR